MSERLKSTNSPVSNEDIIKELTEQFTILSNEDQTSSLGASSKETFEAAEDETKAKESEKYPEKLPENETEVDFDEVPLSEDNSDSETDSIDEEALKDEEVGLTDEERDKRKEKAEELKKAGNDAFAVGEYERSIWKYTDGLKICPLEYNKQRAILYCNRSAAKIKLKQYDKAIKDCTKAIELDEKYLKAYQRRALSYEQTDKLDESFSDYKKILEFDPSDAEARKAVIRLPPLIEEKNEKLKTEMLDNGQMSTKAENVQNVSNLEVFNLSPYSKRCRSRSGRFKRCRSADRRYRVVQRRCRRCGGRRRYRRRRSRCGRRRGRPRYMWRCRSRSGSFKRCRRCDRRHKLRKR